MISAEIKRYNVSRVFPKSFAKEQINYFLFDLSIGSSGDSKAADDFQVEVCDFEALMAINDRIIQKSSLVQFDHLILVKRYDEESVLRMLKRRIGLVEGKNWEDVASQLSWFLYYEYAPRDQGWYSIDNSAQCSSDW